MGEFSESKRVVREYFDAMETCAPGECAAVLKKFVAEDYDWKGVYPFRQQNGAAAVAEKFWAPLRAALPNMQRRMDIFIAGHNKYSENPDEHWVMSTGNFMGLFDADWLGIRHTRKICCLRYAEFNCVAGGKITKTGLFVDILGFMQMAGANPLPYQTGQFFVYPGPRGHNGLLFEDAPPEKGASMLRIIDRLCGEDADYVDETPDTNDYTGITDGQKGYIKKMKRVFEDDVIWYGPCGIGASYTLPRYAQQHGTPFDKGLKDNTFNGHLVRVAEGDMGGFFGWPNLTNTPIGGFLGLPGGGAPADMQVVDVYYRGRGEGGLITENWVYIDLLYWLKQQGLDVLERCRDILNPQGGC